MNGNIVVSRQVTFIILHESSRVWSVECFANSSQSEVAVAAPFRSYIFVDDALPNPQPGASNEFPSRIQPIVSVPLSMLTFYEDIYISELRDSLSKADQYLYSCIVISNLVIHCIIPVCIIFYVLIYVSDSIAFS